MICSLVVDRNVSSFLPILDFVRFRKCCRTLYSDEEAWEIRTKHLPVHMSSARRKLGLHYILSWAMRAPFDIGSPEWYQFLVNWLEYRISIKIIHSFIQTQNVEFFETMDLSELSSRQRWQWEYLWCRNRRLYKHRSLDYDVRPAKRVKCGISHRRVAQSCCG